MTQNLDLANATTSLQAEMQFISADKLSVIVFCVFGFVMFAIVAAAFRKTGHFRRWTGIYLALILLTGGLAVSGLMRQYMIPMAPGLMAILLLGGIVFTASGAGGELSRSLSLSMLIGFQIFRLPLELILHHWAEIGTIPTTMTWTGSNWDVAAGILALIAFSFVGKHLWLAWTVQIICFCLLLNVLRVVILSSPFPFSWDLENPLQLILHFPYVLIAPLFVLPAWTVHLLTFRKLLFESVPKP